MAAPPAGSPVVEPGSPSGATARPSFSAALDSVAVRWTPAEVPQGTLFQVRLSAVDGGLPDEVDATFAGEPIHFVEGPDGALLALAAAPVDASGRLQLSLDLRGPAGERASQLHQVPIVPGDYRMERLTVAPEFGDPLPPDLQRRVDEESARAMAISRASHGTPRMWEWEAPFEAPRGTRITSGFGHGRVFNDQVQSRHMGTDYQGAPGEPVLAPAPGIVALVDSFYLGGNVVYLDHGAGLVTAYLHLSVREVEEGDVVAPGQVIGRVGATGRVTGPHLHWIVRYGVITVDGTSLLSLP